MIPLMLSPAGRTAVIFGGGRVAFRKAAFLSGELDIRVISRSFDGHFDTIPCTCIERDVSGMTDGELRDQVQGAFLVIGALPDKRANDRIGRICRERGIFFNNTDGMAGDVIIPSLLKGKNYCLAVSTFGKSPAVARFVREHLESSLPCIDGMVDLQERLRAWLKDSGIPQARRAELLNAAVRDEEVWGLLATDPGRAWALVEERYAGS